MPLRDTSSGLLSSSGSSRQGWYSALGTAEEPTRFSARRSVVVRGFDRSSLYRMIKFS